MAKRASALPLRSKVNAGMRNAYVALYGQLGHLRPAWGTEASAPLDRLSEAEWKQRTDKLWKEVAIQLYSRRLSDGKKRD